MDKPFQRKGAESNTQVGRDFESVYDRLKRRTMKLQKDIPKYIKEIIEKNL
jgi:hypothetical protein